MIYAMTYSWHQLAKTFFTLALITVLMMSFLGISHMGMTMGADGKMTQAPCPFMNGSGICNMSPLEHIAMWQSLFTSTLQQFNPVLQLLLLIVSIALGFSWRRYLYPPPDNVHKQFRRYSRCDQIPTSFLQELFSQGILNPKLF